MRFSLHSPNLTFRKSFVAVRPSMIHTQHTHTHKVAFSFCLLFNNNKISFQFQLKNSTRKLSQRSRLDNYLHIAAAAAHQQQQQPQQQQQQQQKRSRPSCRKQKSATNCLTKTRKKTLTRPKLKSKRKLLFENG